MRSSGINAVKLCALLAVLTACLLTGSCSNGKKEYTKTVFAMDTVMSLKAYSDNAAAVDAAEEEIKRIERLLDRNDPKSDIYSLNNGGGASEETAEIIKTALDIGIETGGAFDITIAPETDAWGFYGQNYRIPTEEEIEDAMKLAGMDKVSVTDGSVTVSDGVQLDLGGIAKGYASDRVAQVLRENGADSAIISLGGNVYAIGNKPDGGEWRVAVQDPTDNEKYVGSIGVSDKAVVTSGSYQRFFERDGVRYHHIIDPSTGRPSESGLASVTIISQNGAKADALSTAMFVAGLDGAARYWREHRDFEAVLVTDEGEIYVTSGIADSFKSDRDYETIL